MELIVLRNESQEPLYLQLYEGIKRQILQGKLAPQEKLPSKRWWMDEYNLSQNTVENTLFLLQEEGYIVSVPRKGYYVAELENFQGLYISYVESNAAPQGETGRLRAVLGSETVNLNADADPIATESEILYDFTYSGIDTAHMPTELFKRITKDVYDELGDDLAFQGEVQGYEPLRRSICNYLRQSRGFTARPEQVVISAGTEYLFHIIFKLLPQKVFGLENPGYHLLHQLFESNEVAYKAVSLDASGIQVESLNQNKVDVACITPSHQFPTGVIMSLNRRSQLLRWAEEEDGRFIIEDDYDSEFKYQGRPIPALKALDRTGKIIYLGSFSKSISPAIRVSYMVLPDALVSQYRERLPYFGCPVGTVSQKVLHRFIGQAHFEKHLNRMRTLYKKKRGLLVQTLHKASLKALKQPVVVQGAEAGLHLVITFPEGLDEARFKAECTKARINIDSLQHYYMNTANSETPHSDTFYNETINNKMINNEAINNETSNMENCAVHSKTKDYTKRSYLLGYGSLTMEELETGVQRLMECARIAYK